MNRRSGRAVVTLISPSVKSVEGQEMMVFYEGDVMVDFHGIIGEPIVRISGIKECKEIWTPLRNVASIVWKDFTGLKELAFSQDLKAVTEQAKPLSPTNSDSY